MSHKSMSKRDVKFTKEVTLTEFKERANNFDLCLLNPYFYAILCRNIPRCLTSSIKEYMIEVSLA